MDVNLFEIISSAFTIILSTGLGYLVWSAQETRKERQKADNKTRERDKKIDKIYDINEAQTITIDEHTKTIDEILKRVEDVEKRANQINEINADIKEIQTTVSAVAEASREELAYHLAREHAQYKIQNFITTPQLKDYEKRYKIYRELNGNGAIQKCHEEVLALEVRDDLPVINPHVEEFKAAVERVNNNPAKKSAKPASNRKRNTRKPESGKTE